MNKQEVGFFLIGTNFTHTYISHWPIIHEPLDMKLEQCIAVAIQISIFQVG